MRTNEKAAVDVATIGSGRIDQPGRQDLPKGEYTTLRGVVQVVELYLMPGAENAVSTKELQRWTGLSVRDLRAQIVREQEGGVLILSRYVGRYIVPDEGRKGRDELRRFLVTIQSKAASPWRATIPAWVELMRQEGLEHGET